jgi:uncharacterized protein
MMEPRQPLGNQEARIEILKGIIKDLHAGRDQTALKARFRALIDGVDPREIAEMEQQLVAEGLPLAEIQKLCDVHVQLFRESLDRQKRPESPPGHPIHTLQAENRALKQVAEGLRVLFETLGDLDAPRVLESRSEAFEKVIRDLAQVEKHYLRKENLLFPFLEKHGIVGPPQVMWAIHDEVRALLKDVRSGLGEKDAPRLLRSGPALVQTVLDMIYKEDNILFPMALKTLAEEDWTAIYQGEAEIGYALVTRGEQWRPGTKPLGPEDLHGHEASLTAQGGSLALSTGSLSLEQIDLMLRSLPVDVTLVDENDEVRYYSEGTERVFPRSPAIIGRKVQNCHPPKSIATVNRILAAFKEGTKDVAEFWIELGGKFIHIRYYPLRDEQGRYRGTLEVTQDITAIRSLAGQHRLLDWEEETK